MTLLVVIFMSRQSDVKLLIFHLSGQLAMADGN